MKQKLFTLITALLFISSGAWGSVITWNTTDNSTSSDASLSADYSFTGDDAATIMYYKNPNGCKRLKNNGGLYMNGASQWSSSKAQRHFTFKAPSSTGTVSITFAAINGKTDGTGSANVRIYGGTTVAYAVSTLNSSLTSPTIYGMQAGTSDVIITFDKKCTIKEIKWTDVAAPTYVTAYANDFTASPMGAATVSYTNMGAVSSNISSWIGWASTFTGGYVSSSSTCKATLSFATPLELASNGSNRGKIRVYWGHSSNGKTLGLKVNDTSVSFEPTTVATSLYPNVLNIAEYTIPEGTTTISSIEPSGSSSSGTYLFRIEVLTYAAAPGTIVFSPTDENSVETGTEVTLSSANATTIKYQWGNSVVGSSGDWSGAETYSDSNKPVVPAVGSSDNVLSVWAHNDEGDTYGSATYTIIAAKTAVTLAYETTSATITGNEAVTQPVLNVTGATKSALIEAGALEFTSSDATVAEVDANGVITTKKFSATPVVITAKIENNETYSDASATFTLTINPMSFDAPTITFNGTEYEGSDDAIAGLTSGAQITINLPSGASVYGNWSGSKKTNVSDAYPSKPTSTTVSTSTGGTRYLYLVAGNEWGYSPIVNFKFTGVVASDPVFSVASGYLAKDATVNIKTLDKNDVVYYTVTTDGSEPDDPTKSSTKIVDNSVTNADLDIFTAAGTYKIKAIAYAKDDASHGSSIVSHTYLVTEDALATITPGHDKITYVTTEKLDFSGVDGLTAYVATNASASGVTMSPVGAVPASTPLLLIGTAGTTYNVPIVESATAPSTNYLVAGTNSEDWGAIGGYNYILYSDGKFYEVTSGTIATTKAYLHLENDPTVGARGLDIIFDEGETTGVADVRSQMSDVRGDFYNLNGQRVDASHKGIVIVNGKKYFNK